LIAAFRRWEYVGIRILVFLHGTAIMHAAGLGVGRAERVRQSRERNSSVLDFASYVPTAGAVEKLRSWERHGAEIAYLSSHQNTTDLAMDEAVLETHGFPAGQIHRRDFGESYRQLAIRLMPDLIIEDDCESIGGGRQTVAGQLTRLGCVTPRCIVVPEFGGLAHLSDDPDGLLA
jgi:hypothetical protein